MNLTAFLVSSEYFIKHGLIVMNALNGNSNTNSKGVTNE
ncbi:hypothetical protein HMPREF1568_1320 [Providencia alcalifaciens PAL-3]|nr:hypothetical protein HMPREF1568_1320 [Providencia alcalifaciens PAL-3]EUD00230.1 hypothetical protein HMPREF1566_2137 [Providencia alcalifaciens PAL-1]